MQRSTRLHNPLHLPGIHMPPHPIPQHPTTTQSQLHRKPLSLSLLPLQISQQNTASLVPAARTVSPRRQQHPPGTRTREMQIATRVRQTQGTVQFSPLTHLQQQRRLQSHRTLLTTLRQMHIHPLLRFMHHIPQHILLTLTKNHTLPTHTPKQTRPGTLQTHDRHPQPLQIHPQQATVQLIQPNPALVPALPQKTTQ